MAFLPKTFQTPPAGALPTLSAVCRAAAAAVHDLLQHGPCRPDSRDIPLDIRDIQDIRDIRHIRATW